MDNDYDRFLENTLEGLAQKLYEYNCQSNKPWEACGETLRGKFYEQAGMILKEPTYTALVAKEIFDTIYSWIGAVGKTRNGALYYPILKESLDNLRKEYGATK